MPVPRLMLSSNAMRHGEAEAPAEPGIAIATLAELLEGTGFTWFFADLHNLPAHLCTATAHEIREAEARPAGMAREGWMVRRRLARQVVAAARGVDPASVLVATDPMGRPVLRRADERWHLSFSARDTLALIGISRHPIGVDLEIENPDLSLPWNILRPDERAWLEAQPDALQPRGFLRLWTAKEAVVKLLGCGFRMAPERIALPHSHDAHVDIRKSPDSADKNPDYPSPTKIMILTREALRVFVSQSNGEKRGRPQGVSVAVARAEGWRTAGPSLADPGNG